MHYDETGERADDSQIVKAIENLQLSHSGPSYSHALGTNQTIKFKVSYA